MIIWYLCSCYLVCHHWPWRGEGFAQTTAIDQVGKQSQQQQPQHTENGNHRHVLRFAPPVLRGGGGGGGGGGGDLAVDDVHVRRPRQLGGTVIHGSHEKAVRHPVVKVYVASEINGAVFHDFVVLGAGGWRTVVLDLRILILVNIIGGHSSYVIPGLIVLAHYDDVTRWRKVRLVVVDVFYVKRYCSGSYKKTRFFLNFYNFFIKHAV